VTRCALIIHAGAGAIERTGISPDQLDARLRAMLAEVWPILAERGARAAVRAAVELLENEPAFNAGTGSKLQADGVARMSAAIMDSSDSVFSGVINVENIQHPVAAADSLHGQANHVLADRHANAWFSARGFAAHEPITTQRRAEWQAAQAGEAGTVGAVAVDGRGVIAAATSTGGVGMEIPGRVSDTPTVAGTYATAAAGVSLTGIGEHIVNLAAGARIGTRCLDGQPLAAAVARTLAEAGERQFEFGLIAVAADGTLVADQTADMQTLYAAAVGDERHSFLTRRRLHWPAAQPAPDEPPAER